MKQHKQLKQKEIRLGQKPISDENECIEMIKMADVTNIVFASSDTRETHPLCEVALKSRKISFSSCRC